MTSLSLGAWSPAECNGGEGVAVGLYLVSNASDGFLPVSFIFLKILVHFHLTCLGVPPTSFLKKLVSLSLSRSVYSPLRVSHQYVAIIGQLVGNCSLLAASELSPEDQTKPPGLATSSSYLLSPLAGPGDLLSTCGAVCYHAVGMPAHLCLPRDGMTSVSFHI